MSVLAVPTQEKVRDEAREVWREYSRNCQVMDEPAARAVRTRDLLALKARVLGALGEEVVKRVFVEVAHEANSGRLSAQG